MNNNKICNPKVEVPKGINLNDKDYLTILLTCLNNLFSSTPKYLRGISKPL